MALIKVTVISGETVELEVPGDVADGLVSSFARHIAKGHVPENRTIVSESDSFYIDFSKVAIVRREF